jgi:hypothetical protein
MRRPAQRSIFVLAMISLALFVPAVFAKKAPPADSGQGPSPAANADPAKAELSATVAIASIKVGRIALAEDGTLADVKDTVTGVYDRQEAATKTALDKLRAAQDAKSKADAVAAINAADDEAAAYFKKNPTVHDKIAKRAALINAEVGQISKSPDAYLGNLQKVGVGGDALAKATPIVLTAAKKSGGKTDGDSLDPVLDARTQVHGMMSARQLKLLAAQFAK